LAENEYETKFPKYLSSPMQVLWFEMDDLAIIMLSFMMASIFHGWFWLMVIIGPFVYTRAKRKYPRGFLRHLLYLSGIKELNGYPSPFQSEFLE